MKKFKYRQSKRIINWGCSFDSILECKYALSIQEEYEFLQGNISIYYDPRSKNPTNYIRGNIRRYTPDFLIRHKQTKKAYWIEIKPRAYSDIEKLATRKELAERYIRWKGYDWEFKIVYDDEIKLNLDQLTQLNECCKLIKIAAGKPLVDSGNKLFGKKELAFYVKAPDNTRIKFVMFGIESSLKKFV